MHDDLKSIAPTEPVPIGGKAHADETVRVVEDEVTGVLAAPVTLSPLSATCVHPTERQEILRENH